MLTQSLCQQDLRDYVIKCLCAKPVAYNEIKCEHQSVSVNVVMIFSFYRPQLSPKICHLWLRKVAYEWVRGVVTPQVGDVGENTSNKVQPAVDISNKVSDYNVTIIVMYFTLSRINCITKTR